MAAWFWIIGLTAVVWPFALFLYGDANCIDAINAVSRRAETAETAASRAAGLRAEMSKLQEIIKEQDALLAALWTAKFGYSMPDKFESTMLNEYLGIRPNWRPFDREWGIVAYLHRNQPFPWGDFAENLYFPE